MSYESKFIEIGDKFAVTDGPLSGVIANKLNELYANKIDEKTGISMETIVTDQYDNASAWMAIQLQHVQDADENAVDANGSYIFGVSAANTSQQDVDRFVDSVTDMSNAVKQRSIIYATDTAQASAGFYALRNMADENNIPVTSDVSVVYESIIK